MDELCNYINFIPSVVPLKESSDEDFWFIFYKNKLLVTVNNENITIPTTKVLSELTLSKAFEQYLGLFGAISCKVAYLSEAPLLPVGMEFKDLRSVGNQIEENLFFVCGKASQIIHWEESHLFCGHCGAKTEQSPTERAKICPKCGSMNYPRISPAIIVAVTKGESLLLAHNNNFPQGFYSVIAGFVEPGETFEDCVKREVFEEVGIKVKNVKYFSSQPWPFPNSIMIAFTAEYESGNIKADGVEIGNADWFTVDTLPNIPSKISVARKLIDNFIASSK